MKEFISVFNKWDLVRFLISASLLASVLAQVDVKPVDAETVNRNIAGYAKEAGLLKR
jgi:hypothetical protein